MREEIIFDDEDLKSIKKAEAKKWRLENKGYNYKGTIQLGLTKFKMVYEN